MTDDDYLAIGKLQTSTVWFVDHTDLADLTEE
jgi:hypothetical protein